MRHSQKVIATLWSSLLASPLLYACFAYARLSCGEYDPCPTGGFMPYAPVAILLLAAIAALHGAFLVMIWRGTPTSED